jgi:hypothetical protein
MVLADRIAHRDRQTQGEMPMISSHTKWRCAAIITAALALATTAAPVSARVFDLDAQGSIVPPASSTQSITHPSTSPTVNPCSEVCSGLSSGSPRGTSWQQTEKDAALAQARRQTISPSSLAVTHSVPFCPRVGRCVSSTNVPAHNASFDSVRPTGASANQGFQWDDAGIGAGGILLLLIAGGAAAVVGRRRSNHAAIG